MVIRDGDGYFIFYILFIIFEDGRELVSISFNSKYMIRGIIYRDVESNNYGFVSIVLVFWWILVRKVLMEVVIENDSNDVVMLFE